MANYTYTRLTSVPLGFALQILLNAAPRIIFKKMTSFGWTCEKSLYLVQSDSSWYDYPEKSHDTLCDEYSVKYSALESKADPTSHLHVCLCVLNCTSRNFVPNSWSPYLIKLRATDIGFIKIWFLFKNCRISGYKKHWSVLYSFCHEQWWMYEKYENRPYFPVDLSTSFLLLLYMCIQWGVCTVIVTLSHIRRCAVSNFSLTKISSF